MFRESRSDCQKTQQRQYQALDPNAILYTQLNATIVPAHMNVPELVEVGKCMLIKLNNKDHYPLYVYELFCPYLLPTVPAQA